MIKLKNKKPELVLLTGSNGFPFGSAVVQRQLQLANSLINVDFKVSVINTRSPHTELISKREKISTHGHYQSIEYLYCSLLPYRPLNFIKRNILKLVGNFVEFFAILYYRVFKNARYIFNGSVTLKGLKYYYFLSKIFNMQLIYDYVEIVGSLGSREQTNIANLENKFDYQFLKYTDKVIVISSYLENHVNQLNSKKEKIKIPPIMDFSYFDGIRPKYEAVSFFLFCGSAAYIDVIKFIINMYINSKSKENNYHLKLVVNGSQEQLNQLNDYITEKQSQNNIEILSKLSYNNLVSYYKSAKALLIPISNNVQDKARFPFKICEYTASKRPIITSDSGAITEFFKDGENAFIAKTDDSESFTNKLNFVIEQPALSNKVGLNGYELGQSVFNFKSYSMNLQKLLNK